jgi:hypothetical protein
MASVDRIYLKDAEVNRRITEIIQQKDAIIANLEITAGITEELPGQYIQLP